jgi:site-specific recombinase XerC
MNQDAEEENMAAKRNRWQDVDKSEIPVKQLIQSFLLYQEDQNHTPKTVEFYSEKLNRFLKVLGEDAKLRELSIEAVRRYQRASREKGGSKFSQHAYLRSVKTFLRWLGKEGYVEASGQQRLHRENVAAAADGPDEPARLVENAMDPAWHTGIIPS